MEMKMNLEKGQNMIEILPEDCLVKILSDTTPTDSCRLSLVSKGFCSASKSDIVWDKFLPSDLVSIISDSQSTTLVLDTSLSKKSLYLTLSDCPIIIDNGKKSFQLEKKSGKKIYMLSARDLSIKGHCDWITQSNSRFQEVAKLSCESWIEIKATINTWILSANSYYAAFMVFKINKDFLYDNFPVEFTMSTTAKYIRYNDLNNVSREPDNVFEGLKLRSDGFLEIKMGDFFSSSGLKNGVDLYAGLKVCGGSLRRDFILEGIEIRPIKTSERLSSSSSRLFL